MKEANPVINYLYALTHYERGVRYEFTVKDGVYVVTRVWLLDNEREYMGVYNKTAARKFWNGLADQGFVKA
jgi:hypothetical protein